MDELRADFEPVTRRSHAIPAMPKLLATLYFPASVAVSSGVSESSFSGVLSQVFYMVAGFPKLIEPIDWTYGQLVPPSNTEHVYRNHKQTHSLIVQVNSKGVITNTKYPGSVPESFILRSSAIFSKL